MTKPHTGALVGPESQVSGGTIAAILPNQQTQRKFNWQRLVRATRTLETQRLVREQLRALAAYAGNNVIVFPRGRP